MEIGIYTFAESRPGEPAGAGARAAERLADLLEEIALAEQVGLDVVGVGEHHRPDFVVSSPAVVLAAAAARTSRIRLTSAVTVLGSDDPVRVFQDFATLDLLSGGRAEIMAGRGSFTESFPLFGQALDDYDALFSENLELLLALRESEVVSWPGGHRPAIEGRGVYPRPLQSPLPVWVAVGGTPASVVRAGTLGLPLALAIIGGQPARFSPLVALYREAGAAAGHQPEDLRVGINCHAFVGDTTAAAADAFMPSYLDAMNRIGQERGWAPMRREQFDAMRSPLGALAVGTADEVTEKLLAMHRVFRNDRFLLQLTVGPVEHREVMRAIELLGTEVAPAVRAEVERRERARATAVATGG